MVGTSFGLALAASCSVLHAPDEPLAPVPDGGFGAVGGATSSGGQGGSQGGQGGAEPECTGPADCPGPDDTCRHRVCDNGQCDIVNALAGTSCGAGVCTNGIQVGEACDGEGDCVPDTTYACDPYVCNPGGTACLLDCSDVDDCVAGNVCTSDGDCLVPRPDGQPCTVPDACESGHCPADDGVCCNVACAGPCEACAAAKTGGTDGVCSFVTGGTDPDGECAPETCNGNGACGCTPTGQRVPFNTRVANTTTGCVDDDPCPDDVYVWAPPFGPVFQNVGEYITCGGTTACVSNVGIATYEDAAYCQGVWEVYCDSGHVGTIDTVGRACAGTAMTNGCSVSFSARECTNIRLEAAPGGVQSCCLAGPPDGIIVAVSAW